MLVKMTSLDPNNVTILLMPASPAKAILQGVAL